MEARWKITAFKLAAPDDGSLPGAGARGDGTRYAVRMSFATDRPLFPFRTPADQHGRHGLLRVFFIGPEKVAGTLGTAPWDARVIYARRRDDAARLLAGLAPAVEAPASAWLTAFEDARWPRASEGDLFFNPTGDPAPVVPPPIVRTHEVVVPVEALLLAAGAGLVAWRLSRRARRAAPAAGNG